MRKTIKCWYCDGVCCDACKQTGVVSVDVYDYDPSADYGRELLMHARCGRRTPGGLGPDRDET